jgi:hypothetical protein
MRLEFRGEVWHWRGPAPFHFVSVDEEGCARIAAVATMVTYGWGVIPVRARIGRTTWETSMFPREGGFALPIKTAVRRAEGIELGDEVEVVMEVLGAPPGA